MLSESAPIRGRGDIMCQEGSLLVSQASINSCVENTHKHTHTLQDLNQPWIINEDPHGLSCRNSVSAFCRLPGVVQKMMKTSERENVKPFQKKLRAFFFFFFPFRLAGYFDTTGEINRLSFPPREITCTCSGSAVFTWAVAAKIIWTNIKINSWIKTNK